MLFLPALDITEIQFFELFRKSCENNHTRGVGTRNRGGETSFQKTQKVPSLRWQSALCLRKIFCSDCIFYDCNYLSFRKHKKCLLSGGKRPLPLWKMLFRLHFIWLQLFSLSPPLPLPTFPWKKFQVHALFIPKCPSKPPPPQSFDAPMPLIHTPPPSQPAISQYMGGAQI